MPQDIELLDFANHEKDCGGNDAAPEALLEGHANGIDSYTRGLEPLGYRVS